MVQNRRFSSRAVLMSGTFLACLYLSGKAHQQASAQIVPDPTLGSEASQVTRVGSDRDRLTGGAVRGNILFHSFSELNVRAGESAYFEPSGAITNIFSRVTGHDVSDIFGTLGVTGNANLFLLNPNGIVFGPNARLDIGGSFVASTGDRVTFPDGSFFSATQPNNAPILLTMNLTPGLQLGAGQAPIRNQGQLIAGGDLRLNGSELDLGGSLGAWENLELVGGDRVQIRDTTLVPFIAQAGGNLTIEGRTIDIFALNHPNSGLISGEDMVLRSSLPPFSPSSSPLTSPAIIGDAHYWSGGDFRIETTDGSLAAMTSPNDPVIRATGDVEMERYIGASLHILAGGNVRIPGQIQITGPDRGNGLVETVQLSDGSTIDINGQAEPTLDIRAGVDPSVFGNGREPALLGFEPLSTITRGLATTDTPTTADIELGQVTFETFIFRSPISGTALITNQYEPNSDFTGDIQLGSLVALGANVVVDTRNNLRLVEGGVIEATPFPLSIPSTTLNDSASIRLIAADTLTVGDDFRIGNNTLGNTTFSGGITIKAGSFQMGERSQISASSFASQDGGNINIIVQDDITLIGDPTEELTPNNERINTGVVSTVNPNDPAFNRLVAPSDTVNSGGNIRIEGASLTMTDGVTISSLVSAEQDGNAGNIEILIGGDILIDGQALHINRPGAVTGIDTRLGESATGQGGDITLQARNLTLNSAGFPAIRTDSLGKGDAGNIQIDITETLALRNGSAIVTDLREGATGAAGNMTVSANAVMLQDDSLVSTRTSGDGPGGELNITAMETLNILDNSEISAQTTASGRAGNATLTTAFLQLSENAQINTSATEESTTTEQGGSITINADLLNLEGSVSILSETASTAPAGTLTLQPNRGDRLTISGGDNGETFDVSVSTSGDGQGGDLILRADERIAIQGPGNFTARTTGQGQAGSIEITTGNLTLNDVDFSVESEENAMGAAGDILITADRASLHNTTISAEPLNVREGGNIDLQIGDRLFLNQSTISTSTTDGTAGHLTLNRDREPPTTTLRLLNSTLETKADGMGDAGVLVLNAQDVFLSNSSILASTVSGEGGTIQLNQSNQLVLRNRSELSATTDNGMAGDVLIQAREFVALSDESVISVATDIEQTEQSSSAVEENESLGQGAGGRSNSSSTSPSATREEDTSAPVAGNLEITTSLLDVEAGSRIAVDSPTGQAGNVEISTIQLFLNAGEISAATAVNADSEQTSANVSIDGLELLTMENGSFITADALNQANGGNISINAEGGFITASPNGNNDLIARADKGDGGSIQITTEQLLGFREYTGGLEPRQLSTNDMSVTSNLGTDGVIVVNDLGLDPVQGATDLPVDTAPPPLSQGCTPGGGRGSFTNAGQGGIPLGPGDVRGSDRAWEDISPPDTTTPPTPSQTIIEAQAWTINNQGQVVLESEPDDESMLLTCRS